MCYNTSCYERAKKRLGSSTHMKGKYTFSAILSNKAKHNPGYMALHNLYLIYFLSLLYRRESVSLDPRWNHPFPDFYNWNRVKVRYCDGSCYTGDVEAIDPVCLYQHPLRMTLTSHVSVSLI